MKKSELKALIFENLCTHFQDRYRAALYEWGGDDYDDEEIYEPQPRYSNEAINIIEKAVKTAISRETTIECHLPDNKFCYVLYSPVETGLYRGYARIVIKWENADAVDNKYGAGWDFVEGVIRPGGLNFESVDYLLHKVQKKMGLLREGRDEDMVYAEGAELPDATDQMLAKFPTLKHALIRLQTEKFTEFVNSIDWISPKPTEFRINLKNGQNFTLKWMGKDFEATISGKKYYLGQLTDFQQALKKLVILYQEGPMGEEPTGNDNPGEGNADIGGNGMGSPGDFPGGDTGEASEEKPGTDETEAGNSEEEGGDENVKDAKVDFEADDSI